MPFTRRCPTCGVAFSEPDTNCTAVALFACPYCTARQRAAPDRSARIHASARRILERAKRYGFGVRCWSLQDSPGAYLRNDDQGWALCGDGRTYLDREDARVILRGLMTTPRREEERLA